MGLERESVKSFSELDAERRITLLMEHIRLLQGLHQSNPRNTTDNIDVNVALKKAYALLEKELGI